MNKLNKEELNEVSAGGISLGIGLLITAGVVFVIGVIDGFVRPLSCN